MINRIPRSVKITATATGMIVAGAGTTAVNGHYTENGTYNGYPAYELDGGGQWIWMYTEFILFWQWTISPAKDDISSYYYSVGDVATPDLATGWGVGVNYIAPVPTVVAG